MHASHTYTHPIAKGHAEKRSMQDDSLMLLRLQTATLSTTTSTAAKFIGPNRLDVYNICRSRIVLLYSKHLSWIEMPSMEVAHIMCWEIIIHSSKKSFQHFLDGGKNVMKIFSASCLTVACKFMQKTDCAKLQEIRRNIPMENIRYMEMTVLNAFDWCLSYTTVPTLTGLLHLSGTLTEDVLSVSERESLDKIITMIYKDLDHYDLEKRLRHPAVWAFACYCTAKKNNANSSDQSMELLRNRLNISSLPDADLQVENAMHALSRFQI